jgi:hypothetical protein
MFNKNVIMPALCAAILATIFAAFGLARPWTGTIDVGNTSQDYPYIRKFHTWEYSNFYLVRFRWSSPSASLVLPGAGRLVPIVMRVYSDQKTQHIRLENGDGSPFDFALRQGWQRVQFLPQPNRWNGNVDIHFTTPTQISASDGRKRGVAFDWIRLHGQQQSPHPAQAIFIGLSIGLATLLAGWSTRRLWVSIVTAGTLIAASMLILMLKHGAWRLMLTAYTGRLVLVLASAVLLVHLLGRFVNHPSLQKNIALLPATAHALVGTSLVAFVVRFGLMTYPLNYIIDIKYHFGRAVMVRAGKFLDLFLPNPMVTPVQWDPALIVPYAPLYYILNAPLTYLPGNSGVLAMMAFSSAVDALSVLFVGILVLLAGGSRRAAVIATLLAGTMSFGLLMVASWGHLPTLLGQCLMLFTMILWLRLRQRLNERQVRLALLSVMTLAYLSYTLVPMFLGITWSIFLLILLLRRDPTMMPLMRVGLLAALLAILLFYGWHISPLVSKTLPAMMGKVAPTTSNTPGLSFWSIVVLLWHPLQTQFHAIILSAAACGALLMDGRRVRHSQSKADIRSLFIAWAATYPFIAFASMHMMTFNWKDVLYMLPLVSIFAGLFLGKLAHRRWGGIIAVAIILFVFWDGMAFMAHQIVHAYTELK